MRSAAHQVLETMRLPNGLYVASPSDTYRYVWIRDVCYVTLAYLESNDLVYEQAYQQMLDIFHTYRWKVDYHAEHRPQATFEYLHPRYHPETLKELDQPWGNAQNDAIGAFLYGIGLALDRGKQVLRDESDWRLIRQLIQYLVTLEFWHDPDNGMWEENREIHASSVGACTAALLMLRPYFTVDWAVIRQGLTSLSLLLPRESASKTCDLAQLSLIYPYRIVPANVARALVERVETELLRQRGVIRYAGDQYHCKNECEAEWCFGLPWLGLCWLTLGERAKALNYLSRTEQVMTDPGVLPELYYGGTDQANENTPLAWGVSMYIQLFDALAKP